VYSVVDNVAHLELFPKNPAPNVGSFNKWLINEGHAQPLQESQRSKVRQNCQPKLMNLLNREHFISQMDHETRRKVLNSDDPNNLSALFKSVVEVSTSYTDFEAPERSEATEVVELKGPYSPLEMKVCGLVEASLGCTVRVDGDSVNAVLLDDDPEDDHARLLVAGQVAQSAQAKTIKVSQSTLMPNIPGLPMWMTLLFCPRMEPKLTEDGTRVASILCGLGCKEYSDRANFPMHDISLVVDTELQEETIVKVVVPSCGNSFFSRRFADKRVEVFDEPRGQGDEQHLRRPRQSRGTLSHTEEAERTDVQLVAHETKHRQQGQRQTRKLLEEGHLRRRRDHADRY
jgi:hypothetical protein